MSQALQEPISKYTQAEKMIIELFQKRKLNIEDRMWHGDIPMLVRKSNYTLKPQDFGNAKTRLKKRSELMRNPSFKDKFKLKIIDHFVSNKRRPMNELLYSQKQFRKAPRKELTCCLTMSNALMNILPQGGLPLLIGTPAPFSVDPSNYYLRTSDDNLMVANTLHLTSEYRGEIIVGSGIDNEKAIDKALEWDGLASITNNFIIKIGIVDCETYAHHIKRLLRICNKHNTFLKAVLMTSGKTQGFAEKNGTPILDCNFLGVSRKLIEEHSNLHILLMATGQNGEFNKTYSFQVLYMHNGQEIVLDEQPTHKKSILQGR